MDQTNLTVTRAEVEKMLDWMSKVIHPGGSCGPDDEGDVLLNKLLETARQMGVDMTKYQDLTGEYR